MPVLLLFFFFQMYGQWMLLKSEKVSCNSVCLFVRSFVRSFSFLFFFLFWRLNKRFFRSHDVFSLILNGQVNDFPSVKATLLTMVSVFETACMFLVFYRPRQVCVNWPKTNIPSLWKLHGWNAPSLSIAIDSTVQSEHYRRMPHTCLTNGKY